MSKLNGLLSGLLSEFVEEIMGAIRRASIEDIRGERQGGSNGVARTRALGGTKRPRTPIPRTQMTKARPAASQGRKARRRAERPPMAGPNEITDPDMLLAVTSAPPPATDAALAGDASAARSPDANGAAKGGKGRLLEPPPPPAPVAPALRSDETVVRASSAGVVIKRVKKPD